MDLPNTRLWRDDPRPMASPPLIVVPTDVMFDQDLRYVEEESAKHRRKAAVHDD